MVQHASVLKFLIPEYVTVEGRPTAKTTRAEIDTAIGRHSSTP